MKPIFLIKPKKYTLYNNKGYLKVTLKPKIERVSGPN